MSDSKKPKLSEIKAHYEGMVAKDPGAFYLLELVERLGRVIRDDVNPISEIDTIRVRTLLKELEL